MMMRRRRMRRRGCLTNFSAVQGCVVSKKCCYAENVITKRQSDGYNYKGVLLGETHFSSTHKKVCQRSQCVSVDRT